jgi:uncharacterized protein YndB with AHSA1/START domain
MDMTSNEAVDTTVDREITATRVFRAPRALVWRMWTEREHIARWYGPRGFTLTTRVMDVRPGGRWAFVMHGPDGRDYENEIVYVELVEPERIVYDHVSKPSFRTTATLVAQGDETRMTMRMVFATAELRDWTIENHKADVGLGETLGRLGDELARALADDAAPAMVMTRVFDAPRRLVFEAFVKREHLVRWWGPRGFSLPVCDVDPRPGGALRMCMRGPDGQDYWMRGSYREIAPPERLVFASFIHDDESQEIVTTLTFAEQDGKTTLTLRQTVPRAEGPARGQRQGWGESLDRLDALLTAT